jgi:hypothetical protein
MLQGEQKYSYILSLSSALGGGGWSAPRPSRFTPGEETRYPLHKTLGGPQSRSGLVRKTDKNRNLHNVMSECRTAEPTSHRSFWCHVIVFFVISLGLVAHTQQ